MKNIKSLVLTALLIPTVTLFSGCGDDVVDDSLNDTTCTTIDGMRINSDTVFNKSCYKITDDIDISAKLTINPGTVLKFTDDAYIYVGSNGILDAVGTAQKPIKFTGVEHTKGYWRGIGFSGSNHTENELSHVVVEYAGGHGNCGNVDIDNSRIKISDTTFRYSDNEGFCIDNSSNLDRFTRVKSTANNLSAGSVKAKHLVAITNDSNLSGNHKNYLTVDGGSIERDSTWHPLNVPIFFNEDVQVESIATLTIEPGTVLHFGSGGYLESMGILKAIGTPTNPIIFTGEEQTAGYWRGVLFYLSNHAENEIAYCDISYGGSEGNIHVGQASRANIHDNNITNSDSYGVSIFSGVTNPINSDVATSNTFSNNARGDVYRQ